MAAAGSSCLLFCWASWACGSWNDARGALLHPTRYSRHRLPCPRAARQLWHDSSPAPQPRQQRAQVARRRAQDIMPEGRPELKVGRLATARPAELPPRSLRSRPDEASPAMTRWLIFPRPLFFLLLLLVLQVAETWDLCIENTVRKLAYGALAGGLAAMILFRTLAAPQPRRTLAPACERYRGREQLCTRVCSLV